METFVPNLGFVSRALPKKSRARVCKRCTRIRGG